MNHSKSPYSRLCRVRDLTSEKGLLLNNSSAVAYFNTMQTLTKRNESKSQTQQRVPVNIDGIPGGPLLLLEKNILIFPEQQQHQDRRNPNEEDKVDEVDDVDKDVFICSIGVGRESLRDKVFHVTSIDERTCEIITQHDVCAEINGGTCCRGILESIEQYLKLCIIGYNSKACSDTNAKIPLIFKVTDLNVARALAKISCGEEEFLDPSLGSILSKITSMIQCLIKKRIVFFKFEPHRIFMDGFNYLQKPTIQSRAKGRYSAFKTSSYKIYPCPHEDHLDAMEVRYIDSLGNFCIRQEIYLDFGPEELKLYIRNAVAMKERYRLKPRILAQIDPQMFWSALLHAKFFLKTLQDACSSASHSSYDNNLVQDRTDNEDVFSEWSSFLGPGMVKNRIEWFNAIHDNKISLPVNSINGNDWSIDTKKAQIDLGTNCALGAMFVLVKKANEMIAKEKSANKSDTMSSMIEIELLQMYKATKFELMVETFS